jgi:hypothetical protein
MDSYYYLLGRIVLDLELYTDALSCSYNTLLLCMPASLSCHFVELCDDVQKSFTSVKKEGRFSGGT